MTYSSLVLDACLDASHVRNNVRDFDHSRLISRNAAPLSPLGDEGAAGQWQATVVQSPFRHGAQLTRAAAACSDRIPNGRARRIPHAVSAKAGRGTVSFRVGNGTPAALIDRCPHRFA